MPWHPANKVAIRSLRAEASTYLFMAFAALIMVLFMVLKGMGVSQKGGMFGDEDRILIVSNKLAPRYPLPVRYATEIAEAKIPGIESTVAINFVSATMNGDRRQVGAMAADPTGVLRTNTDLVVLGAMGKAWAEDRNSVLVGRDLAAREGLRIGDALSLSSPAFVAAGGEPTLKLRIRGLYSVKDDAYPAMALLMHEKLIRPNGQVNIAQGASAILVLLRDRRSAAEASAATDAMFAHAAVGTRTTLREEFVETFNNQGEGVQTMLRLYGYGGIATGAMLLLTFCYFNATRLHREARILEQIGFSRGSIMSRVALSMTMAVALAACLGIVATWIGGIFLQRTIERSFPSFSVSYESGVPLILALALVTFLFSFAAMSLVLRVQDSQSLETVR